MKDKNESVEDCYPNPDHQNVHSETRTISLVVTLSMFANVTNNLIP